MSDKSDIITSLIELQRKYLETEDSRVLDEFNDIIGTLQEGDDYETILKVFETAIETFPDRGQFYYDAAKTARVWSSKLADDYYESRGVLGMELHEWMFGDGTPYRQFVELRSKAAGYLEKVIELTPGLPPETVAAITEDIADLRHH